jgi:predicted phage-related endonuclease
MAKVLTIAEIEQLIYAKYEAMEQLCFHKNNSLAVERYHDLQDDIRLLRKMAKRLANR